MITRAKNGIQRPKTFLSDLNITELSTAQEALAHEKWYQAVYDE